MNSTVFPLLAAAAALIPSNSPARQSLGQGAAAVSVTMPSAERIDWFVSSRPPVHGAGRRGKTRQDIEFR